jgi:hypothetical protein
LSVAAKLDELDGRMPKAYIRNIVKAGTPDSPRNDYEFGSRPQNSWCWESEDEAGILCDELRRGGVTLRSGDGRVEKVYDFQIEETSPGQFSIWCDLPFIGQ